MVTAMVTTIIITINNSHTIAVIITIITTSIKISKTRTSKTRTSTCTIITIIVMIVIISRTSNILGSIYLPQKEQHNLKTGNSLCMEGLSFASCRAFSFASFLGRGVPQPTNIPWGWRAMSTPLNIETWNMSTSIQHRMVINYSSKMQQSEGETNWNILKPRWLWVSGGMGWLVWLPCAKGQSMKVYLRHDPGDLAMGKHLFAHFLVGQFIMFVLLFVVVPVMVTELINYGQ